ncbi:MAG: RNA polymerase sigma factor RpoD/SigA [bacterium]
MSSNRSETQRYYQEIRKYKHLTLEQELELAKRIQAGNDEQAVRELVEANLRYVVNIARKYERSGIPLADLISEGNLGLLAAAYRFEPDRGVKFITYASWWIRQAICSAITTKGRMIRLPSKQEMLVYNYLKTKDLLTQELGREPSKEEIAERLNLEVQAIDELMQMKTNSISLDTGNDDQEDGWSGIDIPDMGPDVEELVIKDEFIEDIESLLSGLSDREKEILRMRYGFNGEIFTLQQIGEHFNLTRERVRQIERRAIEKLRNKAKYRQLEDYLYE